MQTCPQCGYAATRTSGVGNLARAILIYRALLDASPTTTASDIYAQVGGNHDAATRLLKEHRAALCRGCARMGKGPPCANCIPLLGEN